MKNKTVHRKSRFNLAKLFYRYSIGLRYFYHTLFSNFYYLGKRVTFNKGVTIHNAKHISIGNKVFLEKHVTLKFLEEFSEYGYKLPNLIVDDYVSIGEGTIIAAAKLIHIKKNVLIGPHCFIGDHNHMYQKIAIPIRDQGYKDVKKIVINEGAWIAANVTVCSGITIGKNSVIGANSVVTKNIPDFCLAGGVPAKVIKKYNSSTAVWEKTKKPTRLTH